MTQGVTDIKLRNTNFIDKLEKYKKKLRIKNNIHKAWRGILAKVNQIDANESHKVLANPFHNMNITMNMDRLDHKRDLTYYYKRIINFSHQDNLEEKCDKHGISRIFNRNLFSNIKENDPVKPDETLSDINDIISKDKKIIAYSIRHSTLGHFVFSVQFQVFLAIILILNSIVLALQTDNTMKKSYQMYFNFFESFTNAVFVMELIFKWSYGFRVYWYNLWNIFDCFLVAISLMSLFYPDDHSRSVTASRVFRSFRVFRALRSLRSITVLYRLQLIVETVIKSVYDMINIIALMLMTMIMFSLFGNKVFGAQAQKYFENLDAGMMSLFFCATREGLTDLFEAVPASETLLRSFWRVFIVFSIIIFAFVLTNLIVAVVVTNMEQALKEEERKEKIKMQMKLIEGHSEIPESQDKEIDFMFAEKLNVVNADEVTKDFPWSIQQQKENSILQDLHISHLEKYFLILDAIEQNLCEYSDLKSSLLQMIKIVRDLSEKQSEIKKESKSKITNSKELKKQNLLDLSEFGRKGDILSNLINLEKSKVFSSENVYDFKSISKAAVNYIEQQMMETQDDKSDDIANISNVAQNNNENSEQ